MNINEFPGQELPKYTMEKAWSVMEDFKLFLNNLGLDVVESAFSRVSLEKDAGRGFPVVRDGVDGIRVSFDKESFEEYGPGDDFCVWFTNGFQKLDNEIRKKVQVAWDEIIAKHF